MALKGKASKYKGTVELQVVALELLNCDFSNALAQMKALFRTGASVRHTGTILNASQNGSCTGAKMSATESR